MLIGQLGIRLMLLVGKTVPLPASADLLAAITRVEVINDSDLGDGFEIIFTLGKDQAGNYRLLESGALDPFNRVVIGVAVGVVPEVLISGIIAPSPRAEQRGGHIHAHRKGQGPAPGARPGREEPELREPA